MTHALSVLLDYAIGVGVFMALLNSIRLSLAQHLEIPDAPLWQRFVAHQGWTAVGMLLVTPFMVGSYSRGELSPLPWKAFTKTLRHTDITEALLVLAASVIADLWLLYLPARIYLLEQRSRPESRVRFLAQALNVSIGLLLMTPHNLIYRLLSWLHAGPPE